MNCGNASVVLLGSVSSASEAHCLLAYIAHFYLHSWRYEDDSQGENKEEGDPFIFLCLNRFSSRVTLSFVFHIQIHDVGSDFELLHQLIPKAILPKDYGGDGISLDQLTGIET